MSRMSGKEIFSSQGLILRYFSIRGMKKFLYLTSTAIPVRVCFSVKSSYTLVNREKMVISSLVRISYQGKITLSSQVKSAHENDTEKNEVQQIKVQTFVNGHLIYRLIQEYTFNVGWSKRDTSQHDICIMTLIPIFLSSLINS